MREEYCHRLEREALEAKEAAKAERRAWAEDYAELGEVYDALQERYNRLESAITPHLVGDLRAAAQLAKEMRLEFSKRLHEWATRIYYALECDRYDDPGEHFMDGGRYGYDYGPDWIDGDE